MARFRRLFGKKPHHKPKQLLRAIRKFVAAKTWSGSKRILEQHPELLSDKADAFLVHLIAEQTNEHVIQVLSQHRELLRRCRDVGLDAAFAHLVGPDISSPGAQVIPAELGAYTRKLTELE